MPHEQTFEISCDMMPPKQTHDVDAWIKVLFV